MAAFLWGAVAGSAALIGAIVSLFFAVKKKWIGLVMAFGTGVLLGAAILELLQEAVRAGGLPISILGVLAGALLFTAADYLIHLKGGGKRKQSGKNPQNHSGLAIFIGTMMDAIPESIIIGTGLIEGGKVSLVMIIAIFISNFPEGLSSTSGLVKDGYTKGKILFLWMMVLTLSALSSLFGFTVLEDSSERVIALISSFASGGIIAMVSSTMMPEAYEEGGPFVGLLTVIGLLSSLILEHYS